MSEQQEPARRTGERRRRSAAARRRQEEEFAAVASLLGESDESEADAVDSLTSSPTGRFPRSKGAFREGVYDL